MRLTDNQIAKYQQIYLDTYGEPASKQDVLIQGMALLRLMKVLKTVATDQHDMGNNNDKKIPTN
jgi:hypothetical protein